MWGAVAAAAATVIGSWMQSEAEKKAGKEAAEAQKDAAKASIAEQRRQFDAIQKLLSPYVQAGNTALTKQMGLAGLYGQEEQQKAIAGIELSPIFSSLVKQGEQGILQNASATGGLRGGDIQSTLAQYRPAMLKNEIESQYSKLSEITNMGQNAAAGVGAFGQSSTNAIQNALMYGGDAEAQAALLTGKANSRLGGTISNLGGMYASYNLFNNNNQPATTQGAAGGSAGKF
jgi:hypothetical protein